jgi:hypothetical protein
MNLKRVERIVNSLLYEGYILYPCRASAVVLDDDPGRDLGLLRLPGHRFFFSPEEVEPRRSEEPEEKEGIDR